MDAGCSVDRWGLVAEGAVPSAVVVVLLPVADPSQRQSSSLQAPLAAPTVAKPDTAGHLKSAFASQKRPLVQPSRRLGGFPVERRISSYKNSISFGETSSDFLP